MARPGRFQHSSTPYTEERKTKSDFVFEAEQMGFAVVQRKTVREGWNDSHDTFVVKSGREFMVSQKMKSDRVDWNDCAREARRFAKEFDQ